jgi:purine nucleosidase
VGITTVTGNTSATQAAKNVAKILEAAGRTDVPLAVGSDDRFGPAPSVAGRSRHIHGEDGLGDAGYPDATTVRAVDEAPAELIARVAAAHPGAVALVPIGPFTNVARALSAHRHLAGLLSTVVAMGGVAVPPGNALPLGEFNASYDPAATAVMVDAPWPRPPLLVGLDVTNRATFGEREMHLLAEGRTAAARFLDAPMRFYARSRADVRPADTPACHDLLALMALAVPDLLVTQELPVQVDTAGGPAWGTTVVDRRPNAASSAARWRVALDVDVERFRAEVRAVLLGEQRSP